ncbi:hypothetical protein EYF80_025148 [Liparis tanakae]|uniref:Uncharacterized protein n=1 Tax=Liparis tanakae TaxID=230148 RepID=A0A4Z2HFL4_9TELE|nr:hypothetical protein EYF80_025148 [Liparis tanakae]
MWNLVADETDRATRKKFTNFEVYFRKHADDDDDDDDEDDDDEDDAEPSINSVQLTPPPSPEGLDLGDLFAALASDLVDFLGRCPHHLLHPLLLQLLLSSGQLPAALLPRLLQLQLQLAQHPQLLRQAGLPRPGHLQVDLQVHGRPQQAVQTFELQGRLAEGMGGGGTRLKRVRRLKRNSFETNSSTLLQQTPSG